MGFIVNSVFEISIFFNWSALNTKVFSDVSVVEVFDSCFDWQDVNANKINVYVMITNHLWYQYHADIEQLFFNKCMIKQYEGFF